MHRRSFLKGAAALAAAPVLPAAAAIQMPAAAPVIADGAITASRFRSCLVTYERGFRVFDAHGVERVVMGWVEDLGRVLMIEEQA